MDASTASTASRRALAPCLQERHGIAPEVPIPCVSQPALVADANEVDTHIDKLGTDPSTRTKG